MMASSPTVFNRDNIIGRRYKLIKKLGEGGMGEVWLAEDPDDMSRQFAVKLLSSCETAVRNRLYEEARCLRMLAHEHIIEMYGFEDSRDGVAYLVTDHMEGGSLQRLLSSARGREDVANSLGSGLPRLLALHLIWQAADGLAHMHENGFAHRDLKPANLLLKEPTTVILERGSGVLKLADLGIVDQESLDRPNLTTMGAFVGTWRYAPPEYLEGFLRFQEERVSSSEAVFERTLLEAQQGDVFSLGLILYELWAGSPFFDISLPRLPRRRVRDSIDLARETLKSLQTALAGFQNDRGSIFREDPSTRDLVLDMLDPDPARRPTALEVRDRLYSMRQQPREMSQNTWGASEDGSRAPASMRRFPRHGKQRARVWAVAAVFLLTLASAWFGGYLDGAQGGWMSNPLVKPLADDTILGLEGAAGSMAASEPMEPTPAPLEPTPTPLEPTPAPLEPTPTPLEPTPFPPPPTSFTPQGPKDRAILQGGLVFRSPTGRPGRLKRNGKLWFMDFPVGRGRMVVAPASGRQGRVFNRGQHPDGVSTTCMVLEHGETIWSILCGLRWESIKAAGHRFKIGQKLGPRTDRNGHLTLRLYAAGQGRGLGDKNHSILLDPRHWMRPRDIRP